MKPQFTAGKNIAMKVPMHEYDATISFYRDILGLQTIDSNNPSRHGQLRFSVWGQKSLDRQNEHNQPGRNMAGNIN